ncbi:MAG TPA: matrixin family metalloprotease [Bryobacteraceae bacterium]|nr:matrixin family metalloprotease [Bryobacteraceae bacterium]
MNWRFPVFWLACAAVLTAGGPEKYSYWVEPCTHADSGCQAGDPQLADWALESWQHASAGALEFTRVKNPAHARIRLYWASAEQGLYGEARAIQVDGKRGAEVYVLPAPLHTNDDRLLRDAIVYLTCLHETGHALGLPHTAAFEDIMYSFQYGGDIPEYFGRYRRKLATREDIRRNSGISAADRKQLLAILAH